MIIPEIAVTINSDPDTTLNDLLYIMDYKQFGENSGAFQNKDALSNALMTWYAVNDLTLRKEAVISANSNNRVGELLAKQYGVDIPQLARYKTLDAIKNSDDKDVLDEFYLSDGKFNWLFDDGILDDAFYITETVNDLYFVNLVSNIKEGPVKTWALNIQEMTFSKAKAAYGLSGNWEKILRNDSTVIRRLIDLFSTMYTVIEQKGNGTHTNVDALLAVNVYSKYSNAGNAGNVTVDGKSVLDLYASASGQGISDKTALIFVPGETVSLSMTYSGESASGSVTLLRV